MSSRDTRHATRSLTLAGLFIILTVFAADGSSRMAFGTDSDGWAFKKAGTLTTESK